MTKYKALTFVMLGEQKISPGQEISDADLKKAGQSKESIKALIEGGALSEDMDADIHSIHEIEEVSAPEGSTHIVAGDVGHGRVENE